MPKDPSPLLGYNNNIKHKNRVFHVQTEDSGVKHPHIITHLFMDGGRILKSVKKSYAEFLGVEKMGDLVRQMMKDQHKGMLIALRDGQFDQLLEDAEAPRQSAAGGRAAGESKGAAQAKAAEPTKSGPSKPPPAVASKRASTHPPPASKPVEAKPAAETEGPPTTRMPPEAADDVISLDDDLDVLEDAADEISPAFQPQNDLPPPPANLFRPREPGSGGGYRTLTPVPEAPLRGSKPPAPPKRQPSNRAPKPRTPEPGRVDSTRPPTGPTDPRAERPDKPAARPAFARPGASRPPLPAGRPPTGDPRYAPARPAVIFGQAGPKSGSIFGEDLISDKSLDEVILSYLAEDLESPAGDAKKKKK